MYEIELTVYDENGDNFTLPLDELQAMAVLRVIGFKNNHDGTISTFAPSTMQKALDGKFNPLRAKEVEP